MWVEDPFAVNIDDTEVGGLSLRTPYSPVEHAPCEDEGDCDCVTVGEEREALFFPVAPGTTTPEVPQTLDDVDDWKVIVKGFGLAVNLEYTDDDGNLTVDLANGRIAANVTAAQTATFRVGSYGTIELWRLTPSIAVVARRRYRVYP